MGKISKEWLALIVIVFLTLGIGISDWQKNKPKDIAESNQQQTRIEKEEGNVSVLVEYLSDKSNNSNMVFQIALETHSVNLDAFDFRKDVRLEKDGKILKPLRVDQSGSGHHRKAEITFAKLAIPITVVVMNVSNIPRREFKFTNI